MEQAPSAGPLGDDSDGEEPEPEVEDPGDPNEGLLTEIFGKKRPATNPIAIPEPPKKKRKVNRILLSKTATAVLKATNLSRAECNLVGQYCGTDCKFFKVGDIYVETDWGGRRKPYQHDLDPTVFRGFRVYKVERRTASRIRVKPICAVGARSPWPFNVNRVTEMRMHEVRMYAGAPPAVNC